MAGSVWTIILYLMGQYFAVPFPILASLGIPIIFLYFSTTKNFGKSLDAFLVHLLLLPALVQVFHGGFVNSGAVILWCVLAPIVSLAFKPAEKAKQCFFFFIVVFVLTVLVEIFIKVPHKEMDETIILLQFVFNILGIVCISFFPLLGFSKKLIQSKSIIQQKNKEITDSIKYAKYIQTATLTYKTEFEKILGGDQFLIFKPKDVVSGDFYWVHDSGEEVFLICSDCTGHGVPGAFMTMIGINHLNSIIRENQEKNPARILEVLHRKVVSSLKNSSRTMHDGMDLSICKIHLKTRVVEYASAMSPMFYYNGEDVIKCAKDRISIGDSRRKIEYHNHILEFKKGDCLYLTTDGFIDQFGGPRDKKLGTKRFAELIAKNCHLPMNEQAKMFNKKLSEWQGHNNQIDDITVIGYRMP